MRKSAIITLISFLFSGCSSDGDENKTKNSFKTTAAPHAGYQGNEVLSTQTPPLTGKEAVKYFQDKYDELANKFASIGQKDRLAHDKSCPASVVYFDSNKQVTFDTVNQLAKSPAAFVYRETKNNKKNFLMKVSSIHHIDQLWKESAVLKLLSGYKGITSTYVAATFSESVSQLCQLRTMVMERVGEQDIGEYRKNNGGGPLDNKFVSSVGIAAINLLETLHSTGLVHGDVHGGNFVLYKSDPAASLRIIDFGRSGPYIDAKTGNHVPLTRLGENGWNPGLLSVGELEGWTVSRRDDLFRLAELMIANTDGYIDLESPQKILHGKRNRKFSPLVPEGFVQFYKETMALDFDATPDYNRFRSLIRL